MNVSSSSCLPCCPSNTALPLVYMPPASFPTSDLRSPALTCALTTPSEWPLVCQCQPHVGRQRAQTSGFGARLQQRGEDSKQVGLQSAPSSHLTILSSTVSHLPCASAALRRLNQLCIVNRPARTQPQGFSKAAHCASPRAPTCRACPDACVGGAVDSGPKDALHKGDVV